MDFVVFSPHSSKGYDSIWMFGGGWEGHLSLIEFAYGNSFQAII